MSSTISIAEARNRLTQLPEELARSPEGGAVTVTRRGQPVLAVVSWELYESIMETLDIMSDPELMAALRQSVQEAQQENLVSWDTVKSQLNLQNGQSP